MRDEDTQNEAKIKLARRAVACPGWRWLPGMRDAVDGDRVVSVSTRGQALWVRWAKAGEANQRWPSSRKPDLDDPATLGCLLALVREAWGDESVYARLSGTGGWVCYVRPGGGAGHVGARPFRRTAEAEALVAALEAAP